MIKKQQKWIALLVTVTFVWLLQVSTMPLAAVGTTEQVGSDNAELAPSFVEKEAVSRNQAPKKSILPYILIGVGVVAVAAVLFLVVFKKNYDITGTWQYYYKWDESTTQHGPNNLTFSGNKSLGQLAFKEDNDDVMTGSYTSDGKNVSFVINSTYAWNHTGSFESKDKMSGTFTYPSGVGTGTWYATRSQ